MAIKVNGVQISIQDSAKQTPVEPTDKDLMERVSLLPVESQNKAMKIIEENSRTLALFIINAEIAEHTARSRFSSLREKLSSDSKVQLPIKNLRTASMWLTDNEANYDKLYLSQTLKNTVQESHRSCLYFDSGIDIELPILAWFQNIIMCDPIFKEESAIDAFLAHLQQYGKIEYDKTERIIILNFSWSVITIALVDSLHNEEYILPDMKIWVLLAYLKYPIDMQKEIFEIKWIKDKLMWDFYFYDNRSDLRDPEKHWFRDLWDWIKQSHNKKLVFSYKTPFRKPIQLPNASDFF
jgi:hypothetical protein